VIECLSQSVGELSREAGLEVLEALWILFFQHLAYFRFVAGKTIGPVAHDEKQVIPETESCQP
jgi:hypothetical protein